ncbi:MAG: helix-turn-helix transcriptional regulator [Firmicutes bacterium]|nr:helix-turn-helix transcriptional regulator [Bacillota bacterium]
MQNRLRELRKAQGMTQEKLARAVGTTRQTIHSLERGKTCPSSPLLFKLACCLGVGVEELFWLSERNKLPGSRKPGLKGAGVRPAKILSS